MKKLLRRRLPLAALLAAFTLLTPASRAADTNQPSPRRRYGTDANTVSWLQNLVWHHRYTMEEMTNASGLDAGQIARAMSRFYITPQFKPKRAANAPLLVLPYPGGRHPRIGFLEGAIDPQRETKFSVFTPWDDSSYVVVDLPEAVWSNLGLTYLAHTHIPTIFDKKGIKLQPLEWNRGTNGQLDSQRVLPNDISFGARVTPATNAVHMELWLKNGTTDLLSDLRVQICVMLKGAAGFTAQTNDNKLFSKPFAACRSTDGQRWIITGWESCDRPWGNAPVPCLHADPKFSDCAPGETKRLRGWLSFYQGTNVTAELARIDQLGWRTDRK